MTKPLAKLERLEIDDNRAITAVGLAKLAAALESGALPALKMLDLVAPGVGEVDDPAIEAVFAARPSLTNSGGEHYPFDGREEE